MWQPRKCVTVLQIGFQKQRLNCDENDLLPHNGLRT